jgi:hypothetical protein
MTLEADDLDALRRAITWGRSWQVRESHLHVLPDPLPKEGSEEWVELAIRFAAMAQAEALDLRPWQCEPAFVHADEPVADVYGRRPNEVEMLKRMLRLGLSRYEPNPTAAIAEAEREVKSRSELRRFK